MVLDVLVDGVSVGPVTTYSFFVLEVVQAWIDRAAKQPRTLHHRGRGVFAVDGEVLRLRSNAK